MLDLSFEAKGAEAVAHAAAPTLALKLRIASGRADEQIHSIMLRCQIRIEATRRRYAADEQEKLYDLFGEPQDWSRTLRGLLWSQVDAIVPAFTGSADFDLLVPCTFDLNVAAAKYFHALDDGEIPLCLLFSGTVFYADEGLPLQAAPIPWEKEAAYRLPVSVWREMIDRYYPNNAWLSLRRDVFDRLYRYKRRGAFPTWEEALESLLAPVEEDEEATL